MNDSSNVCKMGLQPTLTSVWDNRPSAAAAAPVAGHDHYRGVCTDGIHFVDRENIYQFPGIVDDRIQPNPILQRQCFVRRAKDPASAEPPVAYSYGRPLLHAPHSAWIATPGECRHRKGCPAGPRIVRDQNHFEACFIGHLLASRSEQDRLTIFWFQWDRCGMTITLPAQTPGSFPPCAPPSPASSPDIPSIQERPVHDPVRIRQLADHPVAFAAGAHVIETGMLDGAGEQHRV